MNEETSGKARDKRSKGAGLDDFPAELMDQAAAAQDLEKQSVDKAIDAWKKLVAAAPTAWGPRRELARVYKKAERWKACAEILKEAVDKATFADPADKVPVLYEMVELYRDRLKLDVMVVNAYNQILTLQPENLEALNELCAQYETMGRWTELIGVLRKRAAGVTEPDEKVELNLRIARLYIEKFQNQAEAIKAFEAVLAVDGAHPEALEFLKATYEKRRDWDKLVALHREEADRIKDPRQRHARRVEVAKLATDKLKKPAVSLELWEKVLEDAPDDVDALSELEKLYEREKQWSKLADVLEKQAAAAAEGKRAALLGKLALLYTEKANDLGKAIKAWQGVLAIEPDNRRGQDAVRKLYLQNKDWDALEGFYAGQNKWDEFVRVLERQAEIEDDASRVGLWNKVGQLYRDRLSRADKAQKAYEKALQLDPKSLAAAEALIPFYEASRDAKHLAAALEVKLSHTTDGDDRQAQMQRIVELYDRDVGDKTAAVAMALNAFMEAPRGAWSREAAERLAGETGAWERLAEAYEAALDELKTKDKLPLLATLARAYEKELAKPETAIERNQAILAIDENFEPAVLALERLYVATGRYAELLAIYDKKLELARTDAEKREVRMRLALLYEEEAKDPDKAVALYTQILKEAPADAAALRALDRLYESGGKWLELTDVIERELKLAAGDDATAAELKFRYGQVLEKHIEDPDGAVASFCEALALNPAHVGAKAALEEYLDDKKRQAKAVAALEPIYEAESDLERLVQVQRIKLKKEKDTEARVKLFLRTGALEAALGRLEDAYASYGSAFREDPSFGDARAALEDVAGGLGRWDDLVKIYAEVLEGAKLPPALTREILLAVAVVHDEKLGQSDKAVEYFRRAQDIAPEDAGALEALERLYTRTERWRDLVDTLKKKADLVRSGDERLQVRVRIASIWEEAIGDADKAIAAWKEVLADAPGHLPALRALDRLYGQQGLHAELAANLGEQLEAAPTIEEQVALLSRLGHLREEKLQDRAGAVETYRRLLELAPGHDDTVAALEQILSDPEHEKELAGLLDPVYRARNDFSSLVRVLEIRARHAADTRDKLALLHEIASGYEDGLDMPDKAYDALVRALAEEPRDEETQRRVERLARVLGLFEDLIGRFEKLVDGLQSEDAKRAVYHKVALLAETELGRDDRAAAAYVKALEVAPRDLDAANALERIYVRNADYANLVLLLLTKLDIVDAPAEKKELGFRAAQLYEEVLESPDKAIEVYQQVFALDERDPAPLENLERLYIRLSRWSDLKDVYAKKAELAQSPAEKKQMLFVLGQVYDRELGDQDKAIETYNAIIDLDPDDFEAIQALDRLYAQAGRWEDLLSVLERQTELSPSPGEVVSLRFRIGELFRTRTRDLPRAVDAYRQVLAMDPGHDPTQKALLAMMAAGEEPVLAAEVLQPIYESAAEWDAVVRTLEVMVRHVTDPVRKVEILSRVADIQERRLANYDAALDAYLRALPADAGNPDVIAQLERLASATGRWADLAQALETEVGRIMESRLQVDTLLRVARIHEQEIGDVDRAIAAHRKVIEIEPDRREALSALDRLYTRTQAWAALVEILRREIAQGEREQEIIELTFRLAQIHELCLQDVKQAVGAYQEILNIAPQHAETRAALERLLGAGQLQHEIAEVLEPLYRMGEEWEKLIQIYEIELGRLTESEERLNLLRRMAEIAEGKLVDQVMAFGFWAKALVEDPTSEQANEETLRLVRATHQWEAFIEAMLAAAQAARDPAVRRDTLLRLAAAFETDLADLARAEEVLGQILADHPKDPQALAFLDRLYDRQGNFEGLADVLRRRIAVTEDSKELTSLNLRRGKVLAEVLGDAEGAIGNYSAVLEIETRSPEALDALERLYFRGELWRELYGVYERMVDIAPGDQALSDCYARMAKIASDVFGQREQAVELWRKVMDLRGSDPVALSALADLHEQAEEWRELTEVVEAQIQATPAPAATIPAWKRLGRIFGEKLGRERNALEAWQKVLEIDPSDVEALRALAAHYRTAGAWEELSETLRRLLALGPAVMNEEDLIDLYAQLGELEGSTLMRPVAAIEAWRQVLVLEPADFRAMAALETLLTQEARWEECIEVLERRAAAVATSDEKVAVLAQVAAMWVDKVGDGGAAAEAYERILQLEPSNLNASLEVEKLYRQRGNWDRLVEILLARLDFVSEPAERIALFTSIAEIYEQNLGSRDNAFVILQAAFREDYSNDHVAKELERLATATGKWTELISEHTQMVKSLSDTRQAADLWVKIARWYDSALGHPDYAIASAQQALGLDPAHTGALAALADFFRKQGRWKDLVGVLARHADAEGDPAKKVGLLLAQAETWETQIGDVPMAVAAYQQAAEADEKSLDAIEALERLYRRMQAWDRLVGVLTRKSHVVDDGELAVKLRLQVGELWEERLGDNGRAIEAYREVLTVDPQNLAALKALERLYERTGDMEKYLDTIEHQLEVTGSDDERVALYARMATVWQDQFDKPERAIECLQKIIGIDVNNQKAYVDLERLYRVARKWDSLVDTYRNHILVAPDLGERTTLTFMMGQVYEDELRDPDRAIEAYNDVLTGSPEHGDALRGLARLYEQTEQWERAVDVMLRLVAAAQGPERVELNYRLGKIYDEQLRSPESAEERLVEALATDSTHVPSMLALLTLYRRRGDSLKAAQLMVRAEQYTHNLLEKTRLLSEAGKLYQRELGDEDKALELFRRTIEIDPEHVEAGEPLADLLVRRRLWAEAVPVLEMLARKLEKRPKNEMAQIFHRLAKAVGEAGDTEKALRYFKQAYDLDPTHLPTVRDRADLLYRMQHWEEAFKLYQTLLVHHRDVQKDNEIVELFYRMGDIRLRLGERPKAILMFEKALELAPGHRATLEALVQVYTEAGDFEQVVKQKRALLAPLGDDDAKIAVLGEIIDLYRNKLQNPQKAIAVYLEALELRPDDVKLLHDVLDLFTETKQWKKAVEILMKLAGLNKGKLKAKYLEAAGNVTNYELNAADEAIELYNQALDEDPDNLKTFERIDKILTAKKDWKNQERAYRKMIKRLGTEVPPEKRQTQVALWHALGVIYRDRQKNFAAATQAFEVCVNLDPDALQRHQILAELYYSQGPEMFPKAIERYSIIVARAKDFADMVPPLKMLRQLYAQLAQYDRAYCVCQALAFLRQADAEEQRFFEQYRPKTLPRAKARLTEELWQKNLFHPDQDRFVSAILAAVSRSVAAVRARDFKDWGLKRKDRHDPSNDQLLFSRVYVYASQVLGVPQPELYLRPDAPGELDLANAMEKGQPIPCFVVGQNFLQGRQEKDLGYALGKKLAYMRPDLFVKWPNVVPTVGELRVAFLAALRLVRPDIPVKAELEAAVAQYLEALRQRVPPQLIEQLQVVVQRFIEAKAEADLNKWSLAVDYTSSRAGFLLCGDLELASRLVQLEPMVVGAVDPKEKIRDLVQWSVSDDYFTLRDHLGLGIS